MKINLFVCAVFAAMITASGVSYAGDCLPGCDCPAGSGAATGGAAGAEANSVDRFGGMMGAISRHADGVRVRDKAYGRQIIKQNDNALAMTCFDYSLAQSSKLGQIFSDVIPSNLPVENRQVFGTSVYPDANAGSVLVKNISDVLNAPMNNHAGNFAQSISSQFLGGGQLGFLSNIMSTPPLSTTLSNINSTQQSFNQNAASFQQNWGQIQTWMGVISGLFPALIPAWYTTISNFINNNSGQVTAANSSLSNYMGQVTSFMSNPATGIASEALAGVPQMDSACGRLTKLWSGGGSAVPALPSGISFQSILGSGSEQNTPYASFLGLLQPGSLSLPAESGMYKELTNTANSEIVSKAWADINPAGNGILREPKPPGPGVSWTAPPPAPPVTATTTDVINLMN